MATISRFMKNTVLKSASYKFVIYDSPLHFRLFGPYDRRLCSNVFDDDDNELLAINYPELIERRRKSKKLKRDHSYSSEFSSKKCRKTSQLSSRKELDKDNYFQSYMLAKELGKVESLEDFLSHEKSYSIFKKNNDLLNVPLACKLFNNCQFPNEKSMLNWIEAVDFGLQHRWMTSLGLSIGLFSFGKLLNNYRGPYDRYLRIQAMPNKKLEESKLVFGRALAPLCPPLARVTNGID
uniref:Uncharacterized protein n=1 Tax=Romanomermis culicivorax TaxID=13658 RepID=A0A915J4J5_ROMCU